MKIVRAVLTFEFPLDKVPADERDEFERTVKPQFEELGREIAETQPDGMTVKMSVKIIER